MRKLSSNSKKEVLARKRICALSQEGKCEGRLTVEHAIIFSGRQLDKPWSLIWLCAYHHSVDQFQDNHVHSAEKSKWVAVNCATDAELKEISKAIDYIKLRTYLNNKYGEYKKPL